VGTTARALWVFLGAAGLLLLLAAMNAASLLLARALDRHQELGVRAALGASRARLVRLLLHESAILTAGGAVLGVVAAYLGVDLFQRYAPESIPRLATVAVDARVVAVAAAVSVSTGLVAGLLPALSLTRSGPWDRLREGGRSVAASALGTRSLLVGGQLALAVVLLAGAGLLFNSFVRVRTADPGFEAEGLVALSSSPTAGVRISIQDINTVWQRWDPVLEALRAIPGVESVAGASTLPFQAPAWAPRVLLEGDDPETVREGIAGYAVTPGYFETMGAEVRRGRSLEPGDGPDGERVVVVNETFVRTQMEEVDPLGAVVRRASEGLGSNGDIVPMRVVGVVEDAVQARVEDGPRPAIYIPYSQADVAQVAAWSPVLRSPLPAAAIGTDVRRAMSGLGRLTQDLGSMEERMSVARTTPRFQSLLAGAFGGAAMLLAAMGLYGSLAETVRRRRRELGIRMALGADTGTVLGMVTGAGMRLSLAGLAVGLVSTLALSRVLRSFLYGVEPYDPLTLGSVALVLLGVSLLACLAPARRATRVGPATVLQAE
jgi:putative ABC transport system permease protein